MKLNRWKWGLCGLACLLAVAIANLAPRDDYEYLRQQFHPREGYSSSELTFRFSQPASTVGHVLKGKAIGGYASLGLHDSWILDNGKHAMLSYGSDRGGCILTIKTDSRPWYVQVWGSLKQRLGI